MLQVLVDLVFHLGFLDLGIAVLSLVVYSTISHMEHTSGFHLEQLDLAWYTLHTQMLQRPVPVIVIKVTEFFGTLLDFVP